MKRSAQKLLLLLSFFCCIEACKKNETSAQQNSSIKTLSGTVTDSRGLPVPSASVVMEHTVWFNNFLTATSSSLGNYSINMPADPAGSWTAKATLIKNAYGEAYKFDLHPHNTASFSAATDVAKNFTWKLKGPRPGSGFYGAHVDVYAMGTNVPLNEVKLVFAPFPGEGTLIDGT
ncbi:MAG: carboxypeptidase regulatory-like domain-containing protein, partial [Sphingobacteriales bacterium]